jgi:hypothetical protein
MIPVGGMRAMDAKRWVYDDLRPAAQDIAYREPRLCLRALRFIVPWGGRVSRLCRRPDAVVSPGGGGRALQSLSMRWRNEMERGFFTALACVMVATAGMAFAAGEDTVPLLPSPLVLPKRIGPMVFSGAPHQYADPALGVSYQYGSEGISLTVYVYDAGIRDLADGADTIPVCREFETAKQGVMQAYQKIELKGEQLVRLNPPDDLPLAREAVYEYEREQRPTISFIWITTAAKFFVKLRLSMDPRLREELPEARRAVLSMVGEAIKPHLTPVDPKGAIPGATMGISVDDSGREGTGAALMYLMLLNAAAERSPEQVPVCGGEFVPTFDADVGLYRGLLATGGLGGTRLGKRIAQIDDAGFLEEFLWVERHRMAWGTVPPAALDLAEFEAWRKKKLRRFRLPAFGSVSIDHPRRLPLEPLAPP